MGRIKSVFSSAHRRFPSKITGSDPYLSEYKCIIIDDVITSGLSINNALLSLKDKVNVVAAAVAFDRQQCFFLDNDIPIITALNKTEVTRFNLTRIINTKKSKFCFAADFFSDIETFKNIINFFKTFCTYFPLF